MAQMWSAAPYLLRRQSARIRKMRIAIPLVAAISLIAIFGPIVTGKYNSFSDGAGLIFGSLMLLIAIWRAAVASAKHHALKVHAWAKENLRHAELFTSYPADASAISAPWVDVDARMVTRAKRAVKERFKS